MKNFTTGISSGIAEFSFFLNTQHATRLHNLNNSFFIVLKSNYRKVVAFFYVNFLKFS